MWVILALAYLLIHGGAKGRNRYPFHKGAEAVHWSCDGSPEFRLEDLKRARHHRHLTLQEEEQEYLESARIRQLVKTY